MAERRALKMHKSLIAKLIKDQTHSKERAILELVQNSIDANASIISLEIGKKQLTIRDDGQGITSRDNIEKHFETLGQPHEDSEAKQFGAFRMGRVQIFAYGKNTWRTHEFQMDIDFCSNSDDDVGYVLHDGLEPVKGCEINVELYQELSTEEWVDLSQKLIQAVHWVKTPILLNGNRVSHDPDEADEGHWNFDHEWYYFRGNRTGMLKVYNLGILVGEFHNNRYGIGGVMVSKAPLSLTISRTDIKSDCAVFKTFQEQRKIYLAQLENAPATTSKKKRRKGTKGPKKPRPEGYVPKEPKVPYIAVTERGNYLNKKLAQLQLAVIEATDNYNARVDRTIEEYKAKNMVCTATKRDRVMPLLGNFDPHLPIMPLFMVKDELAEEDNKDYRWVSLNKIASLCRDHRSKRVTFGTFLNQDYHLRLARRTGLALPVATGLHLEFKQVRDLVDLVNQGLSYQRKIQLISPEELVEQSKAQATVVTAQELSALEKTFIQSVQEGISHWLHYRRDASDEFHTATPDTVKLALLTDETMRLEERTLILDRGYMEQVGYSMANWINMGMAVLHLVMERIKNADERKKLTKELSEELGNFVDAASSAFVTKHSGHVTAVHKEMGKLHDRLVRIQELQGHSSLVRTVIQELKEGTGKLEALLENTLQEGADPVGLYDMRRQYHLPEDWDKV